MSTTTPYLRSEDLQRIFSVSRRTVAQWVADKRLPFFRVGSVVRFDPAAVEAFAQEHTVKTRHFKQWIQRGLNERGGSRLKNHSLHSDSVSHAQRAECRRESHLTSAALAESTIFAGKRHEHQQLQT